MSRLRCFQRRDHFLIGLGSIGLRAEARSRAASASDSCAATTSGSSAATCPVGQLPQEHRTGVPDQALALAGHHQPVIPLRMLHDEERSFLGNDMVW